MRKLTESIIKEILSRTPKEKEAIGNAIVKMLGGDPQKKVKNLPKRRGNADGGIDGRILIYDTVIIEKRKEKGDKQYLLSRTIEERIELAAFNIKLEKSKFSRDLLGAFKNNMEREDIFTGIIVANELSLDAKSDIKRINSEENAGVPMNIYFISLEDLIEEDIKCPIKLKSKADLLSNIKKYLELNL
ncbi:MAG: hypothetical protein ACRCX8_12270 [Sarcina sp.]